MLKRTRSRRERPLSAAIIELIDWDEGCHLRVSPAPSVAMQCVLPPASSLAAQLQDGGSPGSCRPCRHQLSRSARLGPCQSLYFLRKRHSSGQLAPMFTDLEALCAPCPRQRLLEAVEARKLRNRFLWPGRSLEGLLTIQGLCL